MNKSSVAMSKLLKMPDIWKRIEELSMPEPNSGCIFWLGGLDKDGYAMISGPFKKDSWVPVRIARMILTNKLKYEPLMALHTCDVRCCVNEQHLYDGTQQQNVRDMYKRGRRVIVRDQYGKIT